MLDIEPRVGEEAYVDEGNGEESLVKVIVKEELKDGYVLQNPSKQGDLKYMRDKSKVHKIGGTIPLNCITFDDGADVYHSNHMVYSNSARTEEIQNISPWKRIRPEFCAVWGFTDGGISQGNVDDRNVEYEKQRRRLQVCVIYFSSCSI